VTADRPKLEIVDDPVTGLNRTLSAPAPPPAPPATPEDAAHADPADEEPQPQDTRPTGRPPRTSTASDPAEGPRATEPVRSYGQEEKRAVFGRVPRSLSRRLERAVVELRDEFEDLTQEQVLAALLHEHVDAADPATLAHLTDTVRRYRRELGRQ
jgi:hypothetical protein